MRRIFIICAVLLIVSVNFYSQDFSDINEAKSENAEKIDEFGRINEEDLRSRLDNFLVTLQNNPNSKGVIIAYQGTNVLPANFELTMSRLYQNHIRFRNADISRIEIIEGGFRTEQVTEIWLVPPGAEMPKLSETIPKPELPTKKTFLYDRNYLVDSYYYEIDYLDEYILPTVKAAREAEQKALEEEWKSDDSEEMQKVEPQITEEETELEQPQTPEEIEAEKFFWLSERFGEVIKNQKDTSGVLIFYADESVYDIARLQRFIDEGRDRIAKLSEISPAKIQIVFGGYRSSVEAEFWIMPKNGAFPTPTPEMRPVEEIEEMNQENL